MNYSAPVIYLPHGGGPLPLLGDPGHAELVDCLQSKRSLLDGVRGIVLISAHWEAEPLRIASAEHPDLLYDYYGFPPESYEIEYPAPGDPQLADAVRKLLTVAGISCTADPQRGFDHGVFVPMKILHPQADIPIVPVSLIEGLAPDKHLALGAALASLPGQGIAIIGSGMSFHNMQAFFGASADAYQKAGEFDHWLQDSCCNRQLSGEQRLRALKEWEQAPHARYCHPREEHLLPLHVCAAAAGMQAASVLVSADVLGTPVSGFLWQ